MPTELPVTETDKTAPLDAGHTTTEYKLTKWVTVIASVIAVLSALGEIVGRVVGFLPEGSSALRWVSIGGLGIAAIKTILYEISRTMLKVEALKNGVVPPPPETPADANAVLTGGGDSP